MTHVVEQWPRRGVAVLVEHIDLKLGGPALNPAVTIAKLGGQQVGLAGYIGDDTNGAFLVAELERLGVCTGRLVQMQGHPTGCCIVCVHPDGERSFIAALGANKLIGSDVMLMDGLSSDGIFHFGGTLSQPGFVGSALHAMIKYLHQQGVTISTDLLWNRTDSAWPEIAQSLPLIDILMANELEFGYLTGTSDPAAAANRIASAGVSTVALKLGARGCYIQSATWQGSVPAFPVEVVDTTGAGDAFAGAFLYGHAREWPVEACARFANAVAALNVGVEGATDGVRPYEEVLEFMAMTKNSF
jgi:sugar/nucleoside kinase (ribokinase family)